MEGEDRDAAFNGCCKSCRKHIQSVKGNSDPSRGAGRADRGVPGWEQSVLAEHSLARVG